MRALHIVSAVDTTVNADEVPVALYRAQSLPAGPHETAFADPPAGVAQLTRTDVAVTSVRYGARLSAVDAAAAPLGTSASAVTASSATAHALRTTRICICDLPPGEKEMRLCEIGYPVLVHPYDSERRRWRRRKASSRGKPANSGLSAQWVGVMNASRSRKAIGPMHRRIH